MKLKTVRVRRSRPSFLSLALALMITMFCVYLLSLSPEPQGDTDAAAAQAPGSAQLRMEGLEAAFLIHSRSSSRLEARIMAARCAEAGGAGLILADENDCCVVFEAVSPESAGENILHRSADGLTLKISGPAAQIAALSEAIDFLRSQASETGSLAAALEAGDTDASSIAALLEIYRTQGRRAQEALESSGAAGTVPARIGSAMRSSLLRLDDALSAPDPSKIRLIHAAACAEWISMLNEFHPEAV